MIKNFKARCIKNTTYATENKIYEFINGITIRDNGTKSLMWNDAYDFCKSNKAFKPFIEERKEI